MDHEGKMLPLSVRENGANIDGWEKVKDRSELSADAPTVDIGDAAEERSLVRKLDLILLPLITAICEWQPNDSQDARSVMTR